MVVPYLIAQDFETSKGNFIKSVIGAHNLINKNPVTLIFMIILIFLLNIKTTENELFQNLNRLILTEQLQKYKNL